VVEVAQSQMLLQDLLEALEVGVLQMLVLLEQQMLAVPQVLQRKDLQVAVVKPQGLLTKEQEEVEAQEQLELTEQQVPQSELVEQV